LTSYWTAAYLETFMYLKGLLLAESVLKGLQFDSTPFIVASDGCKDSFGAILMQKFTSLLPSGKTVTAAH
ncbi:hypothetical protein F4604DRAFT_1498056, partial [Suillus subluteus]